MLTAIIINIVLNVIGWFLAHRKASDALWQANENARSLMAMHLEMGHITAAEKRREHAMRHPITKALDPESHL